MKTHQIVPYTEPEPVFVGELVKPHHKLPKHAAKLFANFMSAPGLADALMQLHLADKYATRGNDRRECAALALCELLRTAARR